MGVQDFEPAVQEAIKRVQSEEQTRAIVDAARENGIGSINIDLIYGLPEQTAKSFEHTIERVLAIRPERVALFHYAHVPWMKKHQTRAATDHAPSRRTSSRSSRARSSSSRRGLRLHRPRSLRAAGRRARARSGGKLQRNFMGYTTRRGGDMISLGVSSIGDVAGSFVQNAANEADYLKLVAERGFATYRGHTLSREDSLRRDVIVGLMCNGVLMKSDVESKHGVDFDSTFARELEALKPLEQDGLVKLDRDALRLTDSVKCSCATSRSPSIATSPSACRRAAIRGGRSRRLCDSASVTRRT
jgi:oxygen-independent coproporphyrinogen-3 oxidase